MPETPDLAQLLGPFLVEIPEAGRAGFLAMLERAAAGRYRQWADAYPPLADGLLACAGREEEIAAKAEGLFPPDPAASDAIAAQAPGAQQAFAGVFAGFGTREQMQLQAGAERQGAAAWRGLAEQQTDEAARATLLECAALEEASADHLDALLADPAKVALFGD